MLKSMCNAVAIAGLLLSATQAQAAPAQGAAAAKAMTAPIPGPRTCFWYRGPFNTDPYINVAYPDKGAFYWSAIVTIPKDAHLQIKGQFAHSRYMSFVSYKANGQAVESLPDYRIKPDVGSTNPFLVGGDRNAAKRNYSVNVALRADDKEAGAGQMVAGDGRNILAAPIQESGAISIVYRIYVNDKAHPVSGGEPLPSAELTLADGRVLTGEAACAALNSRQPFVADITALGVPFATYRTLKDQKDRPVTWPAQPDIEWHVQHSRPAIFSIFTGNHEAMTARGGGEFYPNPDNRYLRGYISTKFGPVLMLKGKMPTTPKTANGDAKMGEGELRYWSLCSDMVMVNSRTTDCLYDEEVPLDSKRNYIIIASKEKDRPRNARPECGIAWIRLPDNGDSVGDPDISILSIRNMLAKPDFAGAIQNALDDKDLPKMGEYLPKGQYVFPNTVETLFPCPL